MRPCVGSSAALTFVVLGPMGKPASLLDSNQWSQEWDLAILLLLVDLSPGEGEAGWLCAPS